MSSAKIDQWQHNTGAPQAPPPGRSISPSTIQSVQPPPPEDIILPDDATLEARIRFMQQHVARQSALRQILQTAVEDGDERLLDEALAVYEYPSFPILIPGHEGFHSLLALAVFHDHPHLVRRLVAAGFNPNGDGIVDKNLLIFAVENSSHLMVQALLEAGANVNTKLPHGKNSLHVAAALGKWKCIRVLLEWRIDKEAEDERRLRAVHWASKRNHMLVLTQLVEAGCNPHAKMFMDNTPLHLAAKHGCMEATQYLVRLGLSPLEENEHKETPIRLANKYGRLAVETWLRLQVNQEHPPDAEYLTVLVMRSCWDGRINNYRGNVLAWDRKSREFEFTVDDLHLRNEEGVTLLHQAALVGSEHLVNTMLAEGAYPHLQTRDGQTPLDMAQRMKHTQIIKVLQDHDRECKKSNKSPEELYRKLLDLIKKGSDDVKKASQLMCQGAPLEPIGGGISSPPALSLAITYRSPKILSLLLAAGAPIVTTSRGKNLLQLVWESPHDAPQLKAIVTQSFYRTLMAEKARAPWIVDGLYEGMDRLTRTLISMTPWRAGWMFDPKLERNVDTILESTVLPLMPEEGLVGLFTPKDELAKQPKTVKMKLTCLMAGAARADLALTTAFLREAGGEPYSCCMHCQVTPLHAALEAGHWRLAEDMVKYLGGCLYVPDAQGRLPKHRMSPHLCHKLEQYTYETEQWMLRNILDGLTGSHDKGQHKLVMALQEYLYTAEVAKSSGDSSRAMTRASELGRALELAGKKKERVLEAVALHALFLAARENLPQFTYLLVENGGVGVDGVLDSRTGGTALREAASWGNGACVAVLLSLGAQPIDRCNDH